jgi:septum formation protein
MNEKKLHLASSSARRREILTALGLRFTHAGIDLDESRKDGESASAMTKRLAESKAAAAYATRIVDEVVLGADTVVVLQDRIFGKPVDKADALNMLGSLSGRTHHVLTAVTVMWGDHEQTSLSDSEVSFREIQPDEADHYWQSGEAQGKAGAYAIQGLGGVFVKHLVGSYSGVVGLPVFETAHLLRCAGISVLGPMLPGGGI